MGPAMVAAVFDSPRRRKPIHKQQMNPHKINQRGAFVLVWTIRSSTLDRGLRQMYEHTDHYTVHDTFADAEKAYDILRKRHDLFSATIAMTWQSTDYEPVKL